MSTSYEVYSTFELISNGVKYINEREDDSIERATIINTIKPVTSSQKKSIAIDTSNYRNHIYNKKDRTIRLFDKFDLGILKNQKLKRSYKLKTIVYYFKNKFAEVQINQNEIMLASLDKVLDYDSKNMFKARKGYEKQLLCKQVLIDNEADLKYVLEVLNKVYEDILNPKEDYTKLLFNKLHGAILNIDKTITSKVINKGTVYKTKRNFVMISKRKKYLTLKVLNIPDSNNMLKTVGRSSYEPLCRYFTIDSEEQLKQALTFVQNSYKLTNYVAIDVKNNLTKIYS